MRMMKEHKSFGELVIHTLIALRGDALHGEASMEDALDLVEVLF